MRVAVIGSGAMGSLFGGRLAAAGERVILVDIWQEHVDALNDEGLTIEAADGTSLVTDLKATTDAAAVSDADLVLVFVKSIHTRDAVADAAPFDPMTDVLTLQNGLGNPEAIAEVVGEDQVIAGVTAHGSTMVGPGHIRHAGEGPTTIGRYFVDNDDRVTAIAEALTDAGLETTVTASIVDAIWEKVLVNVGINAATALSRVDNGRLVDTEPGRRLLSSAIREAGAVAEAEGAAVREDIVPYASDIAEHTGSNRSSMRQDVEAGRRTEIGAMNGEIVRRGDDHGLDTPVNRTLTDLVRLTEEGYAD